MSDVLQPEVKMSSYHSELNASHGHVSATLAPEVTSTTSGALWEMSQMSSPLIGVGEERGEEEEVWKRYHRLVEVGVVPTEAPCSSPVNSPLPTLRPRRRPHHKRNKTAAASVLRHLNPRVNFYVTQANASEYVMSGKVYTRSATPLWNRALLGHKVTAPHSSGQDGDGQAGRTERSSAGEGGGGGEAGGVSLNLDVTKIPSPHQRKLIEADELSPFALSLMQDHAPGVDMAAVQRRSFSSSPQASNTVSQHHECGRQQGGSCHYGSASRRLGLASEPSADDERREDYVHPVHPFLRMYQTRPGAFARLLSREADLRVARVLPGSTIASLMVPHPAAMAGEREEGEEDEEEVEECVQGTTM